MNMTPQQQNAVDFRRRTLLVSAGAGSGKTSTLSARILSRLTDPDDTEAEIDKFLIVTFTNNSAKDLSEKIEKVLSERAAKDLTDKKALRQLAKLRYAEISTISSFCVGVVKQHFETLGLPARLRICDPIEGDRLLRSTLEVIMEERYAENRESFGKAVEIFSGARSDESFFATILSLYKKVYAYPDPEAFMQKALFRYREVIEKEEFFDTFYGNLIRKRAIEAAQSASRALYRVAAEYGRNVEFAEYSYATRIDAKAFEDLAVCLHENNYADGREAVKKIEKTKAKSSKVSEESRAERDKIHKKRDKIQKKYAEKLKKAYFGATVEKIKQAAADCEEIEAELFSLIRELENRFSDEKRTRGLIDFTDAEKLTYRLFVERYDAETDTVYPTETAKKYRDRFLEIYIDEYQDINRIQDMIFRSICRYDEQGHECNRFMVGDIKQSIYRFRNARPELFSGYLNRFTALSKDWKNDCEHKEYLSNNFRCAENVVKLTNRVFSSIMSQDYGEEDNLIYSRREKYKVELPCEILLCAEERTEEENEEETVENETVFDSVFSDEMRLVASKIRSVVQNPAYVGSDGKMFTYGDVTVLLRSTSKTAERYARCFESFGIPVFTDLTESFFDQNEIKLCLCLLHAIDNPLRNIYLAGAMRSELFDFSDEDLATLQKLSHELTETDGSLWQNIKEKAEKGGDALSAKCADFRDKLLSYKKASVGIPSDQLLLKLYRELKIRNIVSEKNFNRYTENALLRRENLNLLYHCARRFENQSFRGLSAFLDYLAERESDPKGLHSATIADEGGAVKIMSIHASKGLEFPVCILADLGKGFNHTDERGKWILNDTAGIGFKLKDIPGMRSATSESGNVSYSTPFRDAVAAEEARCSIEEEKRILYVGMTRAKELLILTSKMPKESTLSSLAADGFMPEEAGCFCDWILYSLRKNEALSPILSEYPEWYPAESADGAVILSVATPKDAKEQKAEKKQEQNARRVEFFEQRIREKLDRPYAFADCVNLLAKISVSELKNGKIKAGEAESEKKKEKEFAVPDFLCETEETPAERGTANHAFMEHADFEKSVRSVETEAKRLLENGFLTGEQYALLSFPALQTFFESALYSEMRASPVLYREKAFTLAVPSEEVYELSPDDRGAGETVLIQGKIDCFFENPDGTYTVVDFKTDRVKKASELSERYRRQLSFYGRAAESMTGKETTRLLLYSFHTGECVAVEKISE